MKITKKAIIIAAIAALVIGAVAYWYWAKNRIVKYYYRHYEIDDMSHAELVGAVLDTSGYTWAFSDTTRTTNKDSYDSMTDADLRKELRKNITDIMNAAYTGK